MATKIKKALGADVRAWALANGVTVGKRGRFTPAVIEQFNTAHKGKMVYSEGNTKTVPLTVTKVAGNSGRKRKETVEVSPTEVRRLAGLTLENVPSKGPFSKAVLEAAAANWKA